MSTQIQITLPDGNKISADAGTSAYDVVGIISKGLQKNTLAVKINGELKDVTIPLTADVSFEAVTYSSAEGKDIFNHSASHLMAQAVKRIYKDAKFAIGPAIESGFYYDLDIADKLTPESLEKIEKEMEKIVSESVEVKREDLSKADAVKIFDEAGEKYKVEILNEMDADMVSIYRQGDFFDLCRGPHVKDTSYIKSFKLLNIAGAYWRGDEKNKMLQRIYAVAFPDKKMLKEHLEFLEEVKKRDHRKIGKELDLYSTHEDAGAGLIYWHPKGARLRNTLEDWWKSEHFKNGYDLLYTPHIGRATLWETSGHLGFYAENMYSPMEIDGNDYYIKPMNCPFHIKIYQTSLRSYRDLPLRWAELGTVYRYEKSGVLHGLLRVRGFTQDDAHIFCTPDQIESEVREVLRFSLAMWKTLGFTNIKAYLATRPAKSVGDESSWQMAKESLAKAVAAENLPIELDEGGGAFYGPKIDLKVKDALGREWQMTTIQFDFNLPERFDMTYIGEDGQKHRPFMVHRALLGSIERFIGILTEHYAGKFPLWLAPVQVQLINVSDEQTAFAEDVRRKMASRGVRAQVDSRNESMGYRVRESIAKKIPFAAVAGAKEVEAGTLSVRRHGENSSELMKVDEFIDMILSESALYK